MPLFHEQHGNPELPTLVFLHGFLGNHLDWSETIAQLKSNFHCITIDLPGHGNSTSAQAPLENGFEHCHKLIKFCLAPLKINSFTLIGYSLGGRIALDYARTQQDKRLKQLILESSHYGLQDDSNEKQLRYQHDLKWAKRFAVQSMYQSLLEWYQQEVFNNLTEMQREQVIEMRLHNYGVCLANMLLSTSLAIQCNGSDFIKTTQLPISYFFGEKDLKFQRLAKTLPIKENIKIYGFDGLGHNIHQHAPLHYAEKIKQTLI